MFDTGTQNYYEVLDVKPDAGQNEIRQAYLRIKSAYGKDSAALYSLFDDTETKAVLEQIEQAYLVLSSPEKRKEYDRTHGFMQTGPNMPPSQPPPFRSRASAPAPVSATAPSAPAPSTVGAVFSFAQGRPAAAPVAAASAPTPPPAPPVLRHEDYSTPRTLAAASEPAMTTTSGSSSGADMRYVYSESSHESSGSRLGAIRRVDLSKHYERNESVEAEIAAETDFRGQFLKKIREYKGVSIEELSEFTKISRTYITCIESEEYESLPAAVYLRGFILQIAKALRLPHEKAATGYMSHYKAAFLK
jgi:curved DNA-binding protein CbpA